MELFDICNENGQPTGATIERTEAHTRGVCHRTAHVWIVRKQGNAYQVLLQKRAMNKDSFPGKFDTSSAGHIQAGDEPMESAIRELYEELGIKAVKGDLDFAGTFRIQYEKEFHGKIFRDNEVAFVYVYSRLINVDELILQKEELDSVEWFDLEYVYNACRQHDRKFCVPIGGLEIIRRYFNITEDDIEIKDEDVLSPKFKVDKFNIAVSEIGGDDIKYTRAVCTRKRKNEYNAVVFDMDGIIFDSERATMDCWIELADKYGIKNMEEAFFACIGTTMARTREIIMERYGDLFPFDAYAKEASLMYHSKYDGGRLPMKKGVIELLTFLKKEGKKIALASSTRRQTVVNQLKAAGILDYFDAVVCGDMVERSKPAPDIFLIACEEIKVLPEKTYGIEDSYNGIRAAYAGKLRPIMVPDLLPKNDEMEKLAEVILEDLLEVKEYLRG